MTTRTDDPRASQAKQRQPAFASFPTIKILTPPKGRFSLETDEWCLTYCSQNVNGRFYGKEPFCRSICIRKVFSHEVRNIIAFKTHHNVGPNGKTTYPMPTEGQPANVPRILGGKPVEEGDDPPEKRNPKSVKYWDEGWYLWSSKSRLAVHEKMDSMMWDLEQQQQANRQREERREVWQEYQDHLEKVSGLTDGDESHRTAEPSKWWGHIVPPRPLPEFRSQSLLVPLPPDFPPFWDRINKLLAPSYKILEVVRDSVSSGEQKQFAERIWEKARSNEPFILAGRTCSRVYELWKDKEEPTDEDDGRKGPT